VANALHKDSSMMVIGIDAQKCSHTAVTVDETGRQGFVKTVGTTTRDHLRLLKWAVGLAEERLWAIEDCRHLTRRLERDLIAAGESVVRVAPSTHISCSGQLPADEGLVLAQWVA
jgi:transposase